MTDVFEEEVERTRFCNGALILLRRMDSNPEEFMAGDKLIWGDFVHDMYLRARDRYGEVVWHKESDRYDTDYNEVGLLRAFTDAEFDALFTKLKNLEREEYTQQIMKVVFEADKKKKAAERRKTK